MLVLAAGGAGAMLAWFRTQPLLMHESCHPLAPAWIPFGSQSGMNAQTAIHLTVGMIEPHDLLPQYCIMPGDGGSASAVARHNTHSPPPLRPDTSW